MELKYLDLIFDTRYSWILHINCLRDKSDKVLHKLSNMTRVTWVLKPKIIKFIFAIEIMITYGSKIWYRNYVKQYLKLLQLQRHSLISITKCY